MGKKFIMVNGQKMYIDEKDVQDEDVNTPTPEPKTPEDDEEEVKKTAKALGKALKAELGIDELKDAVEGVKKFMAQPENSKLTALLHGKDMVKDKGQLTANEKIVGFFHGLVTRNEAVVKALSEGVDADGGYLFPNEFLAELIKPLPNVAGMRQLVTVVPMRRDALTIPSQGNRPKMYWTAENAAKTTTTASFGTVTITAKKIAAILYASDELIEDSSDIDVVNHILNLFREALQEEEDRVILRGNGTTEPRGIETARAAGEIATMGFGGATTFDNMFSLVYSLKAKYRNGASFLVHPNRTAALTKLKDTAGQYLWQPSVVAGQPDTIRGYPVYEFYDMPENTIYFGNWKQAYWLGDRKKLTVKISQDTDTAFVHDQTAIRVVARFGGNVVLGEAAKAATGA
jgi:HK97 family phage major capsid protein